MIEHPSDGMIKMIGKGSVSCLLPIVASPTIDNVSPVFMGPESRVAFIGSFYGWRMHNKEKVMM